MEFYEMKESMVLELANMFMNAFNAPPWNDKWTEETAGRRIRQMITGDMLMALPDMWMESFAV